MSIISILSTLVFGVGFFTNELDHISRDIDYRNEAIHNNRKSYIDSHGKIYDTITGRQIIPSTRNGHNVALDAKTFKVLRDYTQEDNEKKEKCYYIDACNNGERFYKAPTISNVAYKDRVTGNIFTMYKSFDFKPIFYKATWSPQLKMMVTDSPTVAIKENKMPK